MGIMGPCWPSDLTWECPLKDAKNKAAAVHALQDKYENMGAALVKQVASATNDVAGDGAHRVFRLL